MNRFCCGDVSTRVLRCCTVPLLKEVIERNGTIMNTRAHHRWLCTGNTGDVVDSSAATSTVSSPPQQHMPQTTWDKIIIGEIMEIRQHPNADHLIVCQVSLGDQDNLLQIICGASNAIKGARVPVAVVGSKLALKDPTSGDQKLLKIKKSKLRGEVSQGMICSEAELGLTDKNDGIFILEEDALVGSLVHQWYSIAARLVEKNENDTTGV